MIAFNNILKELQPREMEVYSTIRTFPGITIRETALKLKTFPNCISGRFTALEKKGVIMTKECKYFKEDKKKQPHSKYILTKAIK